MKLILTILGILTISAANGQVVADRYLPFNTTDAGIRHEGIKWGLDTAWDSEANVRRGIAFMGKENVDVMRVSFQPTYALIDDARLTSDQIKAVNSRIAHAKLAGTPELVINDDHLSVDEYFTKNGRANAARWANLIMITKRLYEKAGLKVVTISPFNEPDFGWGQGSMADFREICRVLKTDYADEMEGIRISGGNTLNNDKASEWYNYLKPYVDEGNTHQLAGSFTNYANFFREVSSDGLHPSADEMHNVADALVALEYGMKTGIWWGFDARARGQLCRATHGDRLAYAENRDAWTAAAVYRNLQDHVIECFVGGSERQSTNCSYQFVCVDRDVYFDGVGPTREFVVHFPGGTGYQQGQTNAERVIDVEWGPDIQPDTINGTYQLMCRSGHRVLSVTNTTASSGTQVCVKNPTTRTYDDWMVQPVSSRIGGDFGYFTIKNALSNFPIDGWNWGLSSGSELRVFDGSIGDNEQWYIKYAGDGYYYIVNRYSNLYLTASASSNGSIVNQSSLALSDAKRQLQQWRLIPVDAACEVEAPAVPTGLKAQRQSASVALSWDANTEDDLVGYMVLRADAATGEWNTIARKVKTNTFIDNNSVQGHTYYYAVKAIDYSDNMSAPSDSVAAATSGAQAMIANWRFEQDLVDQSVNQYKMRVGGTEKYISISSMAKEGSSSYVFDGSGFLQLPYQIANTDELTLALWMRWTGSSSGSNQRIFDFGNSATQCMYLTPNNGSNMQFVMRNGDAVQRLNAPKYGTALWRHVAITIGRQYVRLYIGGELVAETSDITLRPSDLRPVLNYIGRSQDGSSPFLKGYIDDLRIYNYELSPSAIAAVAGNLREDVNGDGTVDTQDVLSIYDFIQSGNPVTDSTPQDANHDGIVDTQDVLCIYQYIQKQ